MRRASIVLGALLVALVVPIVAVADAQVPFKGGDAGVWGVGTHNCGALVPVFVESSGQATHVGNYSYSSQECVNFADSTYTGTWEITAANGHTLAGTYRGRFDVVGSNILYEQENTVSGGTGRFGGASGSFDLSGLASLVICATEGCLAEQELTGAISSVGSSK